MKQIILWFAWEMWCWKDAAAEYIFSKYWWRMFKFSSSLRDILDRVYIDKTRENLSKLSTILRSTYWQDILARIMYNDILVSQDDIILIDWVRREDDLVYLRKLPNFKLIYVETSLENRFSRISNRSENADDKWKNLEQFKKEQELETEVKIRWLKQVSDFVFDNNGTKDELYKQIDNSILGLT